MNKIDVKKLSEEVFNAMDCVDKEDKNKGTIDQLEFNDDFWIDPKLRRKLEKVDIIRTRLYRHNALTPDDYKDMLKDADALYNTACEIVDYIQEESYPE